MRPVVEVLPAEYAAAISRLPAGYQRFMSPECFDADALRRIAARCYLNPNRDGGFLLVGPAGASELRGLFTLSTAPPGEGASLALVAVGLGARFLDCFDGHLVGFYRGLGFQEVDRAPFNPAIAPPGWGPDMGQPDLVTMAMPLHGGQR